MSRPKRQFELSILLVFLVWSGQVRIRGFDYDYDCYDCYDCYEYYDYYEYDYYDYDYCDYDKCPRRGIESGWTRKTTWESSMMLSY